MTNRPPWPAPAPACAPQEFAVRFNHRLDDRPFADRPVGRCQHPPVASRAPRSPQNRDSASQQPTNTTSLTWAKKVTPHGTGARKTSPSCPTSPPPFADRSDELSDYFQSATFLADRRQTTGKATRQDYITSPFGHLRGNRCAQSRRAMEATPARHPLRFPQQKNTHRRKSEETVSAYLFCRAQDQKIKAERLDSVTTKLTPTGLGRTTLHDDRFRCFARGVFLAPETARIDGQLDTATRMAPFAHITQSLDVCPLTPGVATLPSDVSTIGTHDPLLT